jgi:tetratricopeptide (TPR) repeat protein
LLFPPNASGQIATLVLGGILCVSCKRDINVETRYYLERGNRYFDNGKYQEAEVMYKNVCRQDSAWGPACYRLGLTDMKLGLASDAARAFRNAIGLLPPDSADHWAAVVRLSELYLSAAPADKQAMGEVATYSRQLLQRDPQSFDGYRLAGDMDYAEAYAQYQGGHREEWQKRLDAAVDEYRKADHAKPGQRGTVMQLARALAAKGDLTGAESLYRSVIAANQSFEPAYQECYRLLIVRKKSAEAEQLLKEGSRNNPKRLEFLSLLADHYLSEGRQDDMRSVIGQIKANARNFDRARLTTGDLYLRAGDRDAAIREYREGAAQDAQNASAYLKRELSALLLQGRVSDAADVDSQILKGNPKDIDARAMEATFLLDRGDVAKATAELQAVLKESPDNTMAKFRLGQAYFKLGEVEQARRQFEETIKLRPNDVAARLALAELQLTRGEFDPALRNASQAVSIGRGGVEGRLIAAAAYRGQRRFGEARKMLDMVLKDDPASAKGLVELGELNFAEGKFPEAEDAFRRARALNPADARALVGIANSEMARNMPGKAIVLLQEEADKAPHRVDLRLALGGTAMRAEKYDIAIHEFQKALVQLGAGTSERGDIYVDIGESYRRKGDLNDAIRVLEEAHQTQPKHVGVTRELALVLDKSGRKPEARETYEAALKLDPDNANILNNLAYLLAETGGNLDEALSKAQRARELEPDLDAALDTVGWIYLKRDNISTAIRIFEGLVEKHNDHSTYHYHLAVALLRKSDPSRAIRELREALKSNPESDEKEKIRQLLRSLS